MTHTAWRGAFGAWIAIGLLAGCGLGVTPESRVKRAEQLIAEGDYAAAMLEIRNALQEAPGDPAAELTLARASLLLNNPEATARTLDQALTHGADKAEVAKLRVQLLKQNGAHAELLKQLDDNSLPLSPVQRELARAQALAGLRRCPEAIRGARPLLRVAEAQVPARIVLAECYAQAGHPQLALEHLQETVRLEPKNGEAWLAFGRVQQLSGKIDEAEDSWRKATENAAGRLTALQQLTMFTALADQQLARGDLKGATETQQRMLGIAPQGGLSMLLGARLKMARGELEPAIAELHELTNKAADFDGARSALASALLAAGKNEQALAEVEQLAHDRPKANDLRSAAELMRKGAAISQEKEEYWLATAGVQVLLGQPAMARLALERAAGLAPDSPRVAAMRVQLELRATNGAEALRLAQELQARRADEPQVLLMLAQAQRMQGSLASSVETLEKLQARQPTSQTAALIYGIRREIDPATALKPLQEWLAKHPDDHTMQAMMADALMSAGQNAESIVAYEKLLALAPKNVIVLNNLAWLYYLEKDKRAIPTARRAYELAPQATNVADTYGWLLLESGANQEALEVLNKIYESGMLIDPEARYHHAAALARNGRQAEAREQLALLLDEAPQFPSRQAAVALAENVK